jgi:hydrogenase maturation protease
VRARAEARPAASTLAAMDRSTTRVRLLVCGERLRRDDAAAILAAELLPADAAALADVSAVGQLSVEAILDVPEGVALVVADAAAGLAPGEMVVLPIADLAGESSPGGPSPASSHSIPAQHVVAMATELRGAAPRGAFVGIGGADFGFGEGLSPAVVTALPRFVETIAEAIRDLAARQATHP